MIPLDDGWDVLAEVHVERARRMRNMSMFMVFVGFGGGCWSVLVVGNDTDSNFLSLYLPKIRNYAVVTSYCSVWFLILYFLEAGSFAQC